MKSSVLKTLRYGSAILMILLLIQCGKDRLPEVNVDLLASETIGPSGGTVETEGLSIYIPPGALHASMEISIYGVEKEDPFPDNSVSGIYRIQGITSGLEKPVRIALKYEGELSGESFLAVGYPVGIVTDENVLIAYDYEQASDSSGFLVGSFQSVNTEGSLKSSNYNKEAILEVAGISFLATTYSSDDHFKIICPLSVNPDGAEYLGECMENAWSEFINMGFNYDQDKLNNVLTKVNIAFYDSWYTYQEQKHPLPAGNCYNWSDTEYLLRFYADRLDAGMDPDEIRITAGRTFFLRFSSLYHQNPGNTWFDLAVATWAEEKFTPDKAKARPEFLDNFEMYPIHGWIKYQAETKSDPTFNVHYRDAHAGFAPLVKYLVNWKEEEFILNMYNNNPTNPTLTLKEVLGADYTEWYPYYLKDFIDGKLYEIEQEKIIDNITADLEVPGPNATAGIFGSYHDLSADLYRIRTGKTRIKENISLRVFTNSTEVNTDNVFLLAYKINDDNNSLEYVGLGKEVLIHDLDQLNKDDEDILIVVINSNYEESAAVTAEHQIELKAERGEAIAALDHATLTIGPVDVSGVYEDPEEYCGYEWNETDYIYVKYVKNGTYEGTTFRAKWADDASTYGTKTSGEVEIYFKDAAFDEITGFKVIQFIREESLSKETYSFNCSNLNMKKDENDPGSSESRYVYNQTGCGTMTFNEYRIEYPDRSACSIKVKESCTCRSDTEIEIQLFDF